MRRISLAFKGVLPSLLAVSVLVMMTTFAGMAVFGMDSGMTSEHAGMADMACVNHCLSALPTSGPTTTPFFATLLVVLTAVILSFRSHRPASVARLVARWLTDIGKSLLHEKLSVVVLRD